MVTYHPTNISRFICVYFCSALFVNPKAPLVLCLHHFVWNFLETNGSCQAVWSEQMVEDQGVCSWPHSSAMSWKVSFLCRPFLLRQSEQQYTTLYFAMAYLQGHHVLTPDYHAVMDLPCNFYHMNAISVTELMYSWHFKIKIKFLQCPLIWHSCELPGQWYKSFFFVVEIYNHCNYRWKNTLDYSIHFGEWRYEEDRTLWLTVQELGAGKVLVKILSEALVL